MSSARICKQAPGQIISSGRADIAALAQMALSGNGAILITDNLGFATKLNCVAHGANGQRPNVW